MRLPLPAADATSQDWEEWEGLNVADLDDSSEVAELREAVIERRRMRGGRRRNVRDEYIRPIVDAQVRPGCAEQRILLLLGRRRRPARCRGACTVSICWLAPSSLDSRASEARTLIAAAGDDKRILAVGAASF
jgi:hypothetical protein